MEKGGCQIAVRCGVIRLKGELLFKLLDCAAGLPFLQQRVGQVVVRGGENWEDANSSIEMIHRFIKSTHFSENKADVVVSVRGIRPEIEGQAELSDCFVEFTTRKVDVPQAIGREIVVGGHAQAALPKGVT